MVLGDLIENCSKPLCIKRIYLGVRVVSIDCQKTKTKVITTTNQKQRLNIIINQWELKVKTDNLLEARKNVSDQDVIGFSFAFY